MKIKTFCADSRAKLDDMVNAFSLDVQVIDMHFVPLANGQMYQQVWFEEDGVE